MKGKKGRPRLGIPYYKNGKWVVRDPELRTLLATTKEEAFDEVGIGPDRESLTTTTERELTTEFRRTPAGNPLTKWLQAPRQPVEGQTQAKPNKQTAQKKPASISPEEKQAMRGLMSGMVVQANLVLCGAFVKLFGVQPDKPEPADYALLDRAWQMQLDIWFGSSEISPLVLIMGGSISLMIAMYAGGEKIPKPTKEKKNDSTGSVQSDTKTA